MDYLRVRKWEKYQTYRTDRGAPPWIKVHHKLRTSAKWACLSDAEKGQLICMWLCAADRQGRIPSDPHLVQKLCGLDNPPDLNKFIELDYFAANGELPDVNMTSSWRQHDSPEERRGEEMRSEEKNTMVDSAAPHQPGKENKRKQEKKEEEQKLREKMVNEFDNHIWPIYPKRPNNPKAPALVKYLVLRKAGRTFKELRDATTRYALFCDATKKIGTETVMQAQTFFGPNDRWRDEFELPVEKLRLPDDDRKLEAFAIEHGLPRPRNERDYFQYRATLRDAMTERGL